MMTAQVVEPPTPQPVPPPRGGGQGSATWLSSSEALSRIVRQNRVLPGRGISAAFPHRRRSADKVWGGMWTWGPPTTRADAHMRARSPKMAAVLAARAEPETKLSSSNTSSCSDYSFRRRTCARRVGGREGVSCVRPVARCALDRPSRHSPFFFSLRVHSRVRVYCAVSRAS